MKRKTLSLTEKKYDLLIVGGGIVGCCVAWDAALRGLTVALVERGDFAHATSANCFKMVHGGIRYLQHGDLYRIWESSHERSALLRIAPHLVRPLPIVVPTYGHGLRSKEILRAGMTLYDLITFKRNWGIGSQGHRIPAAVPISRQECLTMFPGLEPEGLTGGMLFYDGQMYSPTRLALSFLKSAVRAGAEVVNYLEATDLLREGNRVVGIEANDLITGEQLKIRSKVVLNTAGPWAERLLRQDQHLKPTSKLTFSRDAAIVINRRLSETAALAVQGGTKDPDALLSRGNRHLFLVPWRDYTLIGVWHVVYEGDPDRFTLTEPEVQEFLNEFNASYQLDRPLTMADVSMWHAGLVLFGENEPGKTDLSYGKRSLIVDHTDKNGVQGLITVVGVRYTTARGVAEKAVNLAFKKLGEKAPRSATATTPIYGGDVVDFSGLSHQIMTEYPLGLKAEVVVGLLYNYGSAYGEVLRYADEVPGLADTIGQSLVIKAEVIHAVRDEMAQKLADVILRRTDLGTGGSPGDEALRICADLMAVELGWDLSRVQQELDEVKAAFPASSITAV